MNVIEPRRQRKGRRSFPSDTARIAMRTTIATIPRRPASTGTRPENDGRSAASGSGVERIHIVCIIYPYLGRFSPLLSLQYLLDIAKLIAEFRSSAQGRDFRWIIRQMSVK